MVYRTDSGFVSWLRAHVSPRRRAISVFGALALFLFGAVAVLAVHDEAFQLEGNVEAADTTYLDIDDTNPGNPVNTVTRAGDLCDATQELVKPAWQTDAPPYDACTPNDWDSLFDNSGPDGTIAEKGSLPAGFVDAAATRDFRYSAGPPITFDTSDGTTFTGGGSKDPNAISDWRCVGANNVTNKGDLTNVYAALYEDGSGNEFFYFGAEKNEDSGTNNIGLWLLQDDTVGCPEDQTGNGTAFSGAHEPGDLFIVSEFSNGGGISTIVAYQWVADTAPGNPVTPGIDPTPVAVGADCLDTGLTSVGDRLCAVTNGVSISKPWLSVFGGDIDADQLPASFFEGGIELSAFPQFAESCFTSFLFNTRASVSLTAENYDWAMGDIDTCGSKSGTKVEDMDADGTIAEDSANVLDGWTINLYLDDGSTAGALDATDTWLAEDVTDSNGDYSFGSLIPDDYIVCEESQTDWSQSYPHGSVAQATDTCDDLNGNPTNPGDDPQETWGYAFTISATEDETGNDFGNFQQGSKSGTKFEDLNGDGVWDAGEPGLEGWTINVYADDGDGILSSAEYLAGAAGTDDTDANGDYQITGLDPGDYIACEESQTDWFQSYPTSGADCTGSSGATDLADVGWTFAITSGEDETGNDFGNFQQGTKSGTKYEDPNGDGDLSDGTGLPGWTINVYADDGDGILSAGEFAAGAAGTDATDANGDYQITGLDPGDYIACEVLPTDWFQSAPNPGTADCSAGTGLGPEGYAFTVTSGSSEEDNDFGNFQQGTKSGTKYEDPNGDGDLSDGTGLPGWTINVYADDGDGILSAGEFAAGAAGTDATDANGDYQITGLDPGDYIACEVLPTDWFQSAPNPGTADCSAGTGLGPEGYAFTVTSGSSEEDNDFGNFQQGTKSGTKYEDPNGDGDLSDGTGLPGWTINVYADDGDGILSAGEFAAGAAGTDATDANGDYQITGLDPGDYIACEVLPTDWFQSAPNPGTADCSAGTGLGPEGYAFTVTSGSSEEDNDFGNFQQGTKSGTKYEDPNGDGDLSDGTGLPGWTINVYADDGDGILSAGEFAAGAAGTDATDANGDYQITGLDPGDYIACEVLPTDWFQSAPNPGTADCSAGTGLGPEGYAFTVTSGSSEEDNDFGNFQQGTKSGTKYEDPNGDGDLSDGTGLPGWTINVYADDGDGILSAGEFAAGAAGTDATDANGDYQITGLDPGDYIACEVLPTDWFQSAPNPGTADCSAGTGLGPEGYAFTVTSGSSEEDNDFGNFQQGTKSGTKYEDPNGDGDLSDGTGLPGWTINVYADDGDGILSAGEFAAGAAGTDATDANGDYQITGLDPGDYIACEVLPTDWFQSAPNPGTADCSAGTGLGPEGYAFTVTSGSSEEDNDFGNFQQGTKSGTKYEDPNGDGDLSDGTGLPGWTINVYADDGDGILSAGEFAAGAAGTDATDANGDYQITGLDPGDYIACEVLPTDWFQSAPNPGTADCSAGTGLGPEGYAFTVTSGSSEEDNDFGNFQQGTKSGTKYEDPNGDGDLSDGTGLPGWTINVYADDGDGILSAGEFAAGAAGTDATDANGDYQITGLDPGDYIACEVLPTDWFQSAPNPGTADCSAGTGLGPEGYAFTVTSGSSEEDNDFGNFQQGTKSGTKYEDPNGDGDLSDGTGLPGWTINVYADDGDGILSAGEFAAGAAGTDATDANGDYQITGLDPGDYIACEVLPTDWFQSAPNPGTADCSAGTGLGPEGYAFTVTSGSSEEDNDFGNWTPATKSGFKFYDNDEDGSYEPAPSAQNDTILPDWVIELWQWNGSAWVFSASDTTDATGYSFSGLAPGTYAVCEITQTDWVQSFPYSGATLPTGETVFDCTQLTPNGGGTFAAFGIQFTATSGAELTNNLFGNFLVPPGCSLTQGYWKTHSIYGPAAHPDDTWNLITAAMTGAPGGDLGPDTQFFDSGQTWIQVFQTNPKGGNAWYILAHQYMAAVLNQLNGAGNVPGLTQALADAYTLLDYYDGQKNIPKNVNNVLTTAKDRNEAITIAGFLGSYNEGHLGVPHCGEEGFTGFTGTGGLSGLSLLPIGLAPLAARIRRRRRA